jgi:hypothetical protein
MAFWQTNCLIFLRSCHNVFDHRTKGVCLEGLKRRADQVCAGAAAAACIHMHMCMRGMARSGLCQVSVRPDNGFRKMLGALVNAYTPPREHTETCLRSSGAASVTTPRMDAHARTLHKQAAERDGCVMRGPAANRLRYRQMRLSCSSRAR